MNKSRLEAFSDGVFAIVITLLILDVRVPKVPYAELPHALKEILPNIFSYALSFAIVGLYWISHHHVVTLMDKVDRPGLWLNLLNLLFVGFIPFPAALMGEYPFTEIPTLMYGATLLATNLIGFLTWRYICYNRRLLRADVSDAEVRGMNLSFLVVNLIYVLAVAMAFVSPKISYAIYLLIIAFLIVRKPWDRRHKEC